MLTGYSLPRTPTGRSSSVPTPPWHFVGDMMVIEFWADPAATAAALPDGLEPHEDAGRMTAMFADYQCCSDDRSELVDPIRAQYREFLVTVAAKYKGSDVAFTPHIYVNADFSLIRGLIQGFPKKLGSVSLTRTFGLDTAADPGLKSGAKFGGSAAVADRRLAQATVTLEHTVEAINPHLTIPYVNLRYFPRLDAGRHDDPAVNELVRSAAYDRSISQVWEGSATLEFFETPGDELATLAPIRMGRGYRFTRAFSMNSLETLEQL